MLQQPVLERDAEREGGLALDGVEVADAVDRLDEQRPGRGEGGEEDLALHPRAVDEDRERDERDARDRAQELDDRAQAAVDELVGADEHPERDRDDRGDSEPERPALQGLQDSGPERLPAELLE